jgi:site-specific recombinase XerD
MEEPQNKISLQEALKQYQEILLASRNLAPRTRTEYVNDLEDLIDFLETRCFLFLAHRVERSYLESYFAELDRRGFTGNTRRRKYASLRSFFGYLHESELTDHDPTQKLIPPAREHHQPRVLTESEYKRLQLAVAHETRNAAIIELLLQTGMRLSELSRLTVNDIDLPQKISREDGHVGSVHLLGKGRKDRTVTLNWKISKALRAYLSIRPMADSDRLFITKFGEGIGPRAIQNVVAKYLRDAGITRARVHTLRHTFATHMVKKGTKLDVVRQALGHESLETTSIYVELAHEQMDKELQENAL